METRALITRGPFIFGEGDESPPDAKTWVFIASRSRTGSNCLARILSLHPDCKVGQEDGGPFALMTIFTSHHYFVEGRDGFCISGVKVFSPSEVRQMCETWRSIWAPSKLIVGDKQRQLWFNREAVKQVFPNCHIVTTIRHPLDHLASACAFNPIIAGWSLEQKSSYFREHCKDFAAALVESSTDLRHQVIRFEDLGQVKSRVTVVEKLWSVLELRSNLTASRSLCEPTYDAPSDTIGRWRTDVHVADLLGSTDSSELQTLLAACGYSL